MTSTYLSSPTEAPVRLIGSAIVLMVSLILAPLTADGQPAGKVYRIGYLSPGLPETHRVEVFRQALHELGWIEGRNITFEYRWAHNDYARLPALAKEVIALDPDVIFATSPPAAVALKSATRTIAVVFLGGPAVETGLVESLARPGGNLTGLDVLAADLNVKRLDFLKGAIPTASRIAVLWHRANQAGESRPQSVDEIPASHPTEMPIAADRSPSFALSAFLRRSPWTRSHWRSAQTIGLMGSGDFVLGALHSFSRERLMDMMYDTLSIQVLDAITDYTPEEWHAVQQAAWEALLHAQEGMTP